MEKIEICIPAFNEEEIISEAVDTVSLVFREAGRNVLITVSDNASTDNTASIAGRIPGISVVTVPVRGKGAGVVVAARRSEADIFGFIDADLSANPTDIISLLHFAENGDYDIAIGSRLIDSTIVDRGMLGTFSSKMFNMVRKIIVGVKSVEDTQCGLKFMNARGRKILAECKEIGWFFDVEFLARAERAGLRIREVPIHWQEYRFPNRASKLNHVRDSVGAIQAMLRIRKSLKREQTRNA
ncbi:MAG: glycosyltransferase [bacterium]|nr:glycosyltransferase [bacterium]